MLSQKEVYRKQAPNLTTWPSLSLEPPNMESKLKTTELAPWVFDLLVYVDEPPKISQRSLKSWGFSNIDDSKSESWPSVGDSPMDLKERVDCRGPWDLISKFGLWLAERFDEVAAEADIGADLPEGVKSQSIRRTYSSQKKKVYYDAHIGHIRRPDSGWHLKRCCFDGWRTMCIVNGLSIHDEHVLCL